jgi:hypothetical protein
MNVKVVLFLQNYSIDIFFILIILYLLGQNNTINNEKIFDQCSNLNSINTEKYNQLIRYSDDYIDFEAFDNEKGTKNEYIIPNIFHYLIYKNDSTNNYYELTYSNYLSIMSVVYFQQPEYIYLHFYGHEINIDYISGYYWNKLINNKNINNKIFKINRINYTKSKTIFEQKIIFEQHISDLLRLEILIHYGGIFLNTDILLFNSIDYFRTFEISLFSSLSSSLLNINNSIIISNRNARFLKAYHDSFRYLIIYF